MSYKITHKAYSPINTHEITFDMVEKLYEGKGNCCRCGCGGNYFEPQDFPDLIKSVLEKMASGEHKVESIADYIFEIKNGRGKVQTIYLKQHKHNG